MTEDTVPTGGPIRYGDRWHKKNNGPMHSLTEEQARERHEAGDPYIAIIGEGEQPVVVEVSLKTGYVGVRFIKSHGRAGLVYVFRRHGDRLFLSEVDVDTLSEDGRVVRSEVTMIKPDGTVDVRLIDNVEGTLETTPPHETDVSMCWEDIPSFGEYASITRRER